MKSGIQSSIKMGGSRMKAPRFLQSRGAVILKSTRWVFIFVFLYIFLIRGLPSLSEFHIAEQRGDSRNLLEPKDFILIHAEML